MRALVRTSNFKRCFKRLLKRHWDLLPLADVIRKLASDVPSDQLFKDHPLAGKFVNKRECHVTSVTDDGGVVYHKEGDELHLHATGTHLDVFGE